MGEQGESKVEKRLRIEGKGIGKIRVLKKRGMGQEIKINYRLWDHWNRWMYSCRIEHPRTHWSQEIIKRNCQLSSTPSNEEVGYAFIVTRGVRSNTYPMYSAHQRYRHIHYNRLIHLKPQLLKGTAKVKAYSLQLLYSVVTTTALYNNTDPFPACDFIGTSG